MPDDAVLDRVVGTGRKLVVQIGTVEDGVRAAERGAVVVAQGIEAGGHLLGSSRRDELVAALRDRLPGACLVAAGGIGSPAEAERALAAGADGVLLGTAFVVAHESRAHGYLKSAVTAADETDTVITGVYEIGWPGRRHRALATVGEILVRAHSARARAAGELPVPRDFGTLGTTQLPNLAALGDQWAGLAGQDTYPMALRALVDGLLTQVTPPTPQSRHH